MPRIELLGGVRVIGAEAPARGHAVAGRRSRIALAVLAMERGRAVVDDELAEAIWPRALPPTWRPALRSALSRVRDALDAAGIEPVLVSRDGYVTLLLPTDVTVDIEAARLDVDGAEGALSRGDHHLAAAAASRAAGTLGAPLLPQETSEWVERHRIRLRHVRERALHLQAAALLAGGDHDRAVDAAEELIRAEPFGEAGHRLLMRALAGADRRTAALRAYDRCRKTLAEELGVEPDAETAALHLELLGGPATPERALAAPVMPAAVTAEGDRRRLDDWWRAVAHGGAPVLAVSGDSGAGISDLLGELARHVAVRRTAVLWHRPAAGTDVGGLIEAAVSTPGPLLVVVERADAAGDIESLLELPGLDTGRSGLLLGHRFDRPWLAGAGLTRLLEAFAQRSLVRRLVMSPLGQLEAVQLLASMTGRPADDAARRLAAELVAECAGNQGLMRGRVLGLLASGALRVEASGWRVPDALGQEPVPGALVEAVARWADGAPAGLVELLRRTAGATDREIADGDPDADRSTPADTAQLAIHCGLLAEAANGYRFVHPIIGRCWAETTVRRHVAASVIAGDPGRRNAPFT